VNKQLDRLISDYQERVRAAVALMLRSGIQMPYSDAGWFEMDIPSSGELQGGIRYCKHGYGCEVSLAMGEVDFDFGEQGEIGGFDAWRLICFARGRLAEYGFDSGDAVEECFRAEVTAGALVRSGHGLYYVVNVPRSLAVDVDSRLPGDNLPVRNQDRILVLHAHYFQAADLMRENYDKIINKLGKHGHINRIDNVDLRIYLFSWLGFLAVTCEGFCKLNMRLLILKERPEAFQEIIPRCDKLNSMMNQHSDALRKFRNNVVHLRKDVEEIRRFFENGGERLQWVRDLNTELTSFFYEYRILCEVHYAMNGRLSELDTRQKRRKVNIS
jgi:hypothetical protein